MPGRVWAAFALLLVILFGPALFLGKVLFPADILPGVALPENARKAPEGNVLQSDLITQIAPLQAQVRRALAVLLQLLRAGACDPPVGYRRSHDSDIDR